MATLKELIEKHGVNIKVRNKDWLSDTYFEIKSHNNREVVGVHSTGKLSFSYDGSSNWELYVEPKKMVKKYLWAYSNCDNDYITTNVFFSEKECENTGWIKLQNTEIEVKDTE